MNPRKEETFLDHLEALRRALLASILSLAVLYPVAYLLTPKWIRLLIFHAFPAGMGTLHYFGPLDLFRLKLETAFIVDLVLAFPFLLRQGWKFLSPALYRQEKGLLFGGILLSSMLFFAGAFFSAFVMLPLAMAFSGSFQTAEIQPLLGIVNFLTLAGWLMLAFGLMFQTPVAVLLAVKTGLVSVARLRRLRPYAATVILIVSAIVTPPDVVSQVMLAIPTYLLFEGGIFLARWLEPSKRQEASAG